MEGWWEISPKGKFIARVIYRVVAATNNFDRGERFDLDIYKAEFIPGKRVHFGGDNNEDFHYESLLEKQVYQWHDIPDIIKAMALLKDVFKLLESGM